MATGKRAPPTAVAPPGAVRRALALGLFGMAGVSLLWLGLDIMLFQAVPAAGEIETIAAMALGMGFASWTREVLDMPAAQPVRAAPPAAAPGVDIDTARRTRRHRCTL